jgi:hypothetical protein
LRGPSVSREMRGSSRLFVAASVALCAVASAWASSPGLSHRWTDSRARIALRYPAAWHVSKTPFSPVSDPLQRFVLYNHSPLPTARLAPRRDQVIAQLAEVVPPLRTDIAQFPPRPKHYQLPKLGRMEGFDGNRWTEITFRDHGRGFYLFIGVGVNAVSSEPNLLRSLDSLTVRPR